MAPKFLITGATSGLGASVLATLYKTVSNPADIIAASSRTEAAAKLQQDYPGTEFRVFDYDDAQALVKALEGVDRLFFVSTPVVGVDRRARQHLNVIEAAKQAQVGHVYYSSLAFGGYGSDSKAVVQISHLMTEEKLKSAGIPYTSIREGIYADAFPVFAAWYPDTTTIYLPGTADGAIAWTSRAELGEANALLMLRDPSTLHFKDNIALLTGPAAYSFDDLVATLSTATGAQVRLERIPRTQYARTVAAEDARVGHGGKSEGFFEVWASLLDAVGQGEAAVVDPLMAEVLGRRPRDGMEVIAQLVSEGREKGGYTWHQNYDAARQ
ncbi:hypothetical protein FQN53_001504 [Emmonsiellopsis sp. PD_33]|nr:hypothetical protein FQN53_001504 [Emmonsiellopsis sp. PD_33]KAK2796727.1 hypothetical protein FQN51_009065 [Onygenales sp. PD_10]